MNRLDAVRTIFPDWRKIDYTRPLAHPDLSKRCLILDTVHQALNKHVKNVQKVEPNTEASKFHIDFIFEHREAVYIMQVTPFLNRNNNIYLPKMVLQECTKQDIFVVRKKIIIDNPEFVNQSSQVRENNMKVILAQPMTPDYFENYIHLYFE